MLKMRCLQPVFSAFMAIWIMAALSSCSCGDDNKKTELRSEPAATSPAPGSEPGPMEEPPAEVQPKEEPGQLVISPSADTGAQSYTSWPLIISAAVWRKIPVPDEQGTLPEVSPIPLKAKSGSWRESLVLEVKNPAGDRMTWPFHLVNQPDQSLVLGVDDSANAHWWLDPSETQALPEGAYSVTVSFKPDGMDGLPAFIVLDRFYLTVVKEPNPLDPALESAKQYQMADFFLFKGDAKAAGERVDKLLAAEPENLGGLSLKSKLLAGEGKNLEAVNVLGDALSIYYRKYPNADPPLGLLHQRSEVLKDLAPEPVAVDGSSPSN
ncbi:MAG: hypothetical protein M0T82_19645 [Desulfobacteraceae bacterium]|nr:hypothetical protein [Desulfobacteraceae bacterium]